MDTNGVITGTYSNGALVPLYQVALADFEGIIEGKGCGGGVYDKRGIVKIKSNERRVTFGEGNLPPPATAPASAVKVLKSSGDAYTTGTIKRDKTITKTGNLIFLIDPSSC